MKLINIVPPEIKQQRMKKKINRTMTYAALFTAASTLGFKSYISVVEKDVTELKQSINDTKSLKAQSAAVQTELEEIQGMDELLSKDLFPFHKFLYALNVNAPSDMKIVSVDNQLPELVEEVPAGNTVDENGEVVTGEMGETLDPVPGQDASSTPEESTEIPIEGENQLGEKEVAPAQTRPAFTDSPTIRVTGYSVQPDSIALLAEKLRAEPYIRQAKITKVDNYDTGVQNFKLFEIEVTFY